MEYNFCRRCGTKLDKDGEIYRCQKDHLIFPAPKPTVGIIFIRNNKVVLSRRGIEPKKGTLDTIGGFVDLNENFEKAIIREVKEETGLDRTSYGELKYLCSALSPYEYQNEVNQVLSVFFVSDLDESASLIANDDIESIEELELNEIQLEDIGNEDVKIAIETLRNQNA